MGTVNHEVTLSRREGNKGVIVFKWSPLTTTDDNGLPIEVPEYVDKTVQVYGTLGTGGTVLIQGSNDDDSSPTWATMNDANGYALSIDAEKAEAVLENTRLIRPYISAGDGDTSLTVIITCAK
jgi:hypothetical protein